MPHITTADTSKPAHRFAVIGGDGRMTHLAERLAEEGYPVNLLGCGGECLPVSGHEGELRICTTLSKAAEGATALVLPLPATRDGETVACPRDPACAVTLREVTELLDRNPSLRLFGGKLPQGILCHSPRITDYYENEILLRRNADITAEAALMTAMQLTDRTLQGAAAAVLGYGRIGARLAALLGALGATVTVCARREETLFEAVSHGHRALRMQAGEPGGGLLPLCRDHTLLFNTVPAHVLPLDFLLALPKGTLLLDLASAPFGVSDGDVRVASAENALRYLRAPSLPGSYAPRDAGRAIAACILDALENSNCSRERREDL